ncbi:LolA family protein [Taibaiella helva]|uniref:LolA family protein n=1 Tax=Taibaiella helva TaxID=2301235 RepID=UPI000E56B84E|nr:outer membrane lipoprotein carrier protein LolA [Taibaiella helva]
MKKFLALMLTATTFLSFTTSAQDAKAKAILDKVSAKFKGMSSLKANFSLNMDDAKGKSKGTKSGTFLMKGNKYRVNMPGQQIISDGKTVWTYLQANKEVQVASYDPNAQSISPAKLFSGSYNSEYKSVYGGEKTVGGKKVDVIEMTPVSARAFKKVVLYVDKASTMITGGTMYDKNGGSYGYSISGVTPNAKVADTEFTWDAKKNPGVEVVDLR